MSGIASPGSPSVVSTERNLGNQPTPITQPQHGSQPMAVPQTEQRPHHQLTPMLGTPPSLSTPPSSATPPSSGTPPQLPFSLQNPDNRGMPFVRMISNCSNFSVGNITHWNAPCKSNMADKSEAFVNYCRKEDHLFVETGAYSEALAILNEHHVVNILGGSGEGKTALLKHLTLAMEREGVTPLEITKPEEIEENYSEGTKFLFVGDDPFGGPYLQQDCVNNWVKMGKPLAKYLQSGRTKIAFASRKTIWADCHKCLGDLELFRHITEVASHRLTREEKIQLLSKHFAGRSFSETDKQTLAELDNPIAFPHCCKLASECEDRDFSFDRILNVFKRPFDFLQKELQKLSENTPCKYSVLVLIMLSGGALPCDQLNVSDATPEMEQMVNHVLDSCGVACIQRPFGQLKKCADSLVGTFVNRGQNCSQEDVYCFSHDSMFKAVAVEFGKDHVSDFLKFSRTEWIIAVCCPQHYQSKCNEPIIEVHKRHFKKLAEKFTRQILLGNSRVSKVFDSPFVKDKAFQKAWLESIEASGRCAEFLKLVDWLGKPLLYCAAYAGSWEIVKYLLKQGVCCKTDNLHYHPLVGAARGGHVKELSTFLENNTPEEVIKIALEDACYSGYPDTVDELFSLRTDICVGVVGQALFAATLKGHKEIVSSLLNYCPTPADIGNAFVEACARGHYKIITYLLCVKKDICSSRIDEGVIGAARTGQVEILTFLFDKTISMKAIAEALASASQARRYDVVRFIMFREFPEKVDVCPSLVSWAKIGDFEMTHFLLQYLTLDDSIEEALNQACQFDHIDVVKLFHSHRGLKKSCLVFACQSAAKGNAMNVIQFLITLNPPHEAIEQAVISAARYGNAAMMEYLLLLKQDIAFATLETAFLVAARKGQCKIVKLLLAKGVDINVKDKNGKTAYDLASEYWKVNVVNILLAKGAKTGADEIE